MIQFSKPTKILKITYVQLYSYVCSFIAYNGLKIGFKDPGLSNWTNFLNADLNSSTWISYFGWDKYDLEKVWILSILETGFFLLPYININIALDCCSHENSKWAATQMGERPTEGDHSQKYHRARIC